MTSGRTPTDVVESGVRGLFRVALPDGSVRLAAGDTRGGPTDLIGPDRTIADILRAGRGGLSDAVAGPTAGPVPTGATILAPLDAQEVWAAGVTYRRSHEARVEEASEPSVYDKVYVADRPELFFKSTPARVRATAEAIGIRTDSSWDVPEPELILVITPSLEIAGYALGDDVSSRSIEGDNALYLPQAKFYRWSCAIGPALVPADAVELPLDISLTVRRGADVAFAGSTSTAALRRSPDELVAWLGRALDFPDGALLMTGTGIVPDASFTLQPGDDVEIDGGPLGILRNPVDRVEVRPVNAPLEASGPAGPRR
ncbi:MAG: fumarylacetoacetate hydrolase family protein [Chloroflexota bacterium]